MTAAGDPPKREPAVTYILTWGQVEDFQGRGGFPRVSAPWEMYEGAHRSSPQEDQSWNGVFCSPNHSILTPKLAENTSRFFIHPEREIALLGRPEARRIGSGPLDDQWSIVSEMFPQTARVRFRSPHRFVALRMD
jgi:hypothetical protein